MAMSKTKDMRVYKGCIKKAGVYLLCLTFDWLNFTSANNLQNILKDILAQRFVPNAHLKKKTPLFC